MSNSLSNKAIFEKVIQILESFFTSPDNLSSVLEGMDKKDLIKCLIDILQRYANDVNSSALRELFTLIKAGYIPTPGKLGYNGKSSSGIPCDVKPINVRSDSKRKRKLNGGGNFSDFTYERLERFFKDDTIMLVSGFVDGRLMYILEFPFPLLKGEIKRQLDKFFTKPRRSGEYLRSASFSFKHYKGSSELKIIYVAPNLGDFKDFITRDLYSFLKTVK